MGRGGFRGRGFDRGRGNYRGNRGGGFFTPPGNIRSRDSSNNIYSKLQINFCYNLFMIRDINR